MVISCPVNTCGFTISYESLTANLLEEKRDSSHPIQNCLTDKSLFSFGKLFIIFAEVLFLRVIIGDQSHPWPWVPQLRADKLPKVLWIHFPGQLRKPAHLIQQLSPALRKTRFIIQSANPAEQNIPAKEMLIPLRGCYLDRIMCQSTFPL